MANSKGNGQKKKSPLEINSKEYWEKRFVGHWSENDGPGQTRFYAELLHAHLPDWLIEDVRMRRMSLCDWGCAEGEAVAYFSQIFTSNKITGIDFAETAIASASKKYPKHEFITANWLANGAKVPQYDVVMTSHVLEHFTEPIHILRDVLAQAARKYILILVPFAEPPDRRDPEHNFRFLKSNLPMGWDDWSCVYFEILDSSVLPNTRYRGEQAVIVYARKSWLQKNHIELTLANYPVEVPTLTDRLQRLSGQVADLDKGKIIAERKLETQLVHDQILLKSNNALQQQNDRLKEELEKANERLRALDQERARLDAQAREAQGHNAELAGRLEALEPLAAESERLARDRMQHELRLAQAEEQQVRLERELADARERCAQLEGLQERLAEENSLGERQREDMEQELALLRKRCAEQAGQVETVQARMEDVRQEKQVLEEEKTRLLAECEALGRRAEAWEAERQRIEAELTRAEGQRQALEQAKIQQEKENIRLQEQCTQLIQKGIQQGAQKAQLEQQQREAREENDRLREHGAALQARLDRLADERTELEREKAALEERAAFLDGQGNSLLEEKNGLQNELAQLGEKLARAGDEKELMAQRLGELEQQFDALGRENAHLHGQSASQAARAAELQAALEQMESESTRQAAGAEQARQAAESRMFALEDRLNGLAVEKEALEQTVRTLAEEKDALQHEKAEMWMECSGLASQNEALTAAKERLEAEQAALAQHKLQVEEERDIFATQAADLNQRLEELEPFKFQLEQDKTRLEAENARLRQECEGIQNDRNGLRGVHAQLLQQYTLLQKHNEQLQRNLGRQQEAGEQLRQRAAELAEQGAQARREAGQRAEESILLRQESELLQRDKALLQEEAARLQQQVAELTRQGEQLCGDLASLNEARARLQQEHETTLGEKTVMAEELAQLQRRSTELWERGEQLQHDNERLQAARADMENQLARADERAAELRADIVRLTQLSSQLQQDQQHLMQARAALEQNAAQLKGQLAQMRDRGDTLAREKEQLHQEIAQHKDRHEQLARAGEQLAQERARLESTNAQLQMGNKRLEAARRDQEEAIRLWQEKSQNLQTIVEQLQQRIKSMNDNINQIGMRNKHLQKTVGRLEEERVGFEKARKELDEIKSMYYYRWACKIDRMRVVLGLRPDPKKPRQIEGPERKVAGLIEDKSEAPARPAPRPAPAPAPEPKPAPAPQAPPPPPRIEFRDRFTAPKKKAAQGRPVQQLTVAGILDKFTLACFEPECNMVTFRPDNWQSVLEQSRPDFLFVESAWNGNGGAWQYRIGTYAAPPGRELDDVLAWCRQQGVPTVFWNKEDPPHFEKFIAAASKFDQVFTTDANCIERYRKHCGHERIDALPFAAQQRIHNPVLTKPRERNTCFAGTYYADTFEARRLDMEVLLRGGAAFGLDIYDRMHGYAGADRKRFAFPDEFQPMIQGRLEYEQMLDAYRWYRVFLNVNSIYDSPTMFSRRVFELLACGTPVVTTPSLGVGLFFGDIVPQVRTLEETQEALVRLLGDPEQWWQTSARGIRLVLGRHTYARRLKTICDKIGLDAHLAEEGPVAVVVTPDGDPVELTEGLRLQTEPADAVYVLERGKASHEHARKLQQAGLNVTVGTLEKIEAQLHLQCDGGLVAFMNGANAYGPNYLRDAKAALACCGRNASGMSAYYAADAAGVPKVDDTAGEEYFLRDKVLADTLVVRVDSITAPLLAAATRGGMMRLDEPAYARSRFEFVARVPGRLAETFRQKVFLKLPD